MHLQRKFHLPASGLILEIGGGGNPSPCSTVLVDYYIDEDQQSFRQRGGLPFASGEKVLIQADGASLPFRDRQFDYVILSHVIEHIPPENIEQFIRELGRVAQAGYIEAPSIVYESIRDIPEHIWYVACEDSVLHLCRKKSANPLHTFLAPLFKDGSFRAVVENHAGIFFTGMEWRGSPTVKIHADCGELMELYPSGWALGEVLATLAQEMQVRRQMRTKDRLKKLLPPVIWEIGAATLRRSWHIGSAHSSPPSAFAPTDWRSLVVCPQCHSALDIDLDRGTMRCTSCQGRYVIRTDGVPSFIARDAAS
jgi:hypothetical protein